MNPSQPCLRCTGQPSQRAIRVCQWATGDPLEIIDCVLSDSNLLNITLAEKQQCDSPGIMVPRRAVEREPSGHLTGVT